MKLKVLVGNGKKIGLLTAPFLLIGLILNIVIPSFFNVGEQSIISYFPHLTDTISRHIIKMRHKTRCAAAA